MHRLRFCSILAFTKITVYFINFSLEYCFQFFRALHISSSDLNASHTFMIFRWNLIQFCLLFYYVLQLVQPLYIYFFVYVFWQFANYFGWRLCTVFKIGTIFFSRQKVNIAKVKSERANIKISQWKGSKVFTTNSAALPPAKNTHKYFMSTRAWPKVLFYRRLFVY